MEVQTRNHLLNLNNLENNNSFAYKTALHENTFKNNILIKLEEDGLTNEKTKELIKKLSEINVVRLELHLRTLVTVLEFSPIILSKKLRDKVYNSLAKFTKINRKQQRLLNRIR
ncbi:hypothetical protein RhiirA4_456853 [Rhizophagus irregularis]|uniref:Uncharacterized protein n=1 Tax=Rhizophagus irregularis TaxID=588596 RepID=A0A2I1G8M3_9GLOM|nr:hypothetical protein RhiirA4_456853 [Rhizophagus irregularis]